MGGFGKLMSDARAKAKDHSVVLPFPAIAQHVVDKLAPRRLSCPYLEAIGQCIENQDALAELLLAAERQGQPYPLHVLESFRFNAAKAQGLTTYLLKSATERNSIPIAEPASRSVASAPSSGIPSSVSARPAGATATEPRTVRDGRGAPSFTGENECQKQQ